MPNQWPRFFCSENLKWTKNAFRIRVFGSGCAVFILNINLIRNLPLRLFFDEIMTSQNRENPMKEIYSKVLKNLIQGNFDDDAGRITTPGGTHTAHGTHV